MFWSISYPNDLICMPTVHQKLFWGIWGPLWCWCYGSVIGFHSGKQYIKCKRLHFILATASQSFHLKMFQSSYSKQDLRSLLAGINTRIAGTENHLLEECYKQWLNKSVRGVSWDITRRPRHYWQILDALRRVGSGIHVIWQAMQDKRCGLVCVRSWTEWWFRSSLLHTDTSMHDGWCCTIFTWWT